MVDPDLAPLGDAYFKLGALRTLVEREGMSGAIDQREAVALGKVALRCDLARDAIFAVLLTCQVHGIVPSACGGVDRIVKGA